MIFFNCTFVWSIKYTKHSICFGVEKDIHISSSSTADRQEPEKNSDRRYNSDGGESKDSSGGSGVDDGN
jgi:hypothetical protein